jgi:epoxyqueuosine reductase
MTMDIANTTISIKHHALNLGFDACGIASVESEADDGFDAWLAAGYHADMAWMERTRDIRQHVEQKVPGAKSVVVVAKSYFPHSTKLATGVPRIASYAWRRDYHKALRKPLNKLAAYISEITEEHRVSPETEGTVTALYASIDTGPVRERIWAYRAGIGFIGRNGLIIHPKLGSWIFLATIITTAELLPEAPIKNHCGTCRACMVACPTKAIIADYTVDSRKCIAYHTIENKGTISKDIADNMNGWVFGCDACQLVCPWNKKELDKDAHVEHPEFASLDAAKLAEVSEEQFHMLFDGTPVVRAKCEGIRRNAKIFTTETQRHRDWG